MAPKKNTVAATGGVSTLARCDECGSYTWPERKDSHKGTCSQFKGITHRVRRGKVVEIPPEWRGKVTWQQTIRKRKSKQTKGG